MPSETRLVSTTVFELLIHTMVHCRSGSPASSNVLIPKGGSNKECVLVGVTVFVGVPVVVLVTVRVGVLVDVLDGVSVGVFVRVLVGV